MTAVCLFADNHHAYLATDGVAYDVTTGKVEVLTGKALSAPSVKLVFAITGRWGPVDLANALSRQPVPEQGTQAALLAITAGALRELYAYRLSEFADVGLAGGAVFAALYDEAAARPRTMMMHTEAFPGRADADAWTWHEDEVGFVMPLLSADDMQAIFPRGTLIHPRREMAKVIKRQRHMPSWGGLCGVGGTCHFYRVGADGVESDEMLQFPEAIGEKLNARRPGRFIPSRLDKKAR